MKITTDGVGHVLSAVYAGMAALIPLLIDQHVISAAIGTGVGLFTAAFAGAWHGTRAVAAKQAGRP